MDEKEYQNDFFGRKGFRRQTCKSCGTAFWSESPREICAETPCTPYSFIGNSPLRKSYTVEEFRELYLRFFEQRGHTRVVRYPVVPRWRDDVFFVQASIYDFQPWVTSGAVEPPANPLVISQPCLRFTDVTEVGVTKRHLTGFEMLAHHAFNSPAHQIYFKDRTVELCHELLTSELGVPGEMITYKEEEWEGGGDMGPSLSVGLAGLEVATLVFMQYSKKGGVVKPLPLRIVDTGYGLERFTWVSQGTPTIYDAIFGKVFQDLPDSLSPQDRAILVDHSRSFVLMLTDGAVPSNVQEGYLARMLLRRMMRVLAKYRGDLTLLDLVEGVRTHLSRSLPGLDLNPASLREILVVEEKRFQDTIERGRSHIRKLNEKLGKEGRSIGVSELLLMYDSMGITPDIVQEEVGSSVQVPSDFFTLAAKLHDSSAPATDAPGAAEAVRVLPEPPSELPPTKVLYHLDPYTLDFEGEVLWTHGNWLVLANTYFYPTGGGQITDTGTIGGIAIEEVVRSGPWVLHRAPEGTTFSFAKGAKVPCKIHAPRRRQLMQHHTATHILNGTMRRLLGSHAWQAGAYKGMDEARLDVTHYQNLSPAELRKIERLANEIVREDRPVKSYFLPRTEAEGRFGFSIYQGGAVPGKELRIIEVTDFDVEACGGTHCTHTSETGFIKIISAERIQDGMVRLHFAAGDRALDLVEEQSDLVRELSAKLATPLAGIPRAVDDLLGKVRETEKASRNRSAEQVSEIATRLLADPHATVPLEGGFRAVRTSLDIDPSLLKDLARQLTSQREVVAILAAEQEGAWSFFVASGTPERISAKLVLDSILSLWPGKGGGNPSAARASGPAGNELNDVLEQALATARALSQVSR